MARSMLHTNTLQSVADMVIPNPEPPRPLMAGMEPFWDVIIASRTHREWADHKFDLSTAYSLALAQRDAQRIEDDMETTPRVLVRGNGTHYVNPVLDDLQRLRTQVLLLARALKLGAKQDDGQAHKDSARKLARDIDRALDGAEALI
jgi:hypothetical protein